MSLIPTGGSLRTVLSHPKLVSDYATLSLRLTRFLDVPRSCLAEWHRDLVTRADLPRELARRWHVATRGGALHRYSGGATLGPANEVLYHFVRAIRPAVVLETGTAAGFSSSFILQALHDNDFGQLYSISLHDANLRGYPDEKGRIDQVRVLTTQEIGEVIPPRLKYRWNLTVGPTERELEPLLARLGTIGMFFRDDHHTAELMAWEFQEAWTHLVPQGLLVSDDIEWNASFSSHCRQVDPRRVFTWFGRGAAQKR
jgi:hypothetical protein